MNLQKIDTAKTGEYMKRIFSFRSYTNYFGQSFSEGDLYLSTEHTFILVKPDDRDFHRVYASSNDKGNLIALLKSMEGINVLNVPTKGDITTWEQIMSDAGYENIGIYERFYYPEFRTGGDLDDIIYAKLSDLEEIYNLYSEYEGFSPYTDHLPSRAELKQFIENDYVLINKQNDKISGAHLFSIKGKKCDLRLLFDMNNKGIKLILDMFEVLNSKGVSCAYGWVNIGNVKAKTIYQLMGAQIDILKDYTYIKK